MLPTKKTNSLSPEALDFSPGLLSIQENPPARLPRAVMYVIGTLLTILLLWAIFGKLDIIASAEGRLVPQTYVKIVQPADAGIIEHILVKEGERVAAGQVLMRMDTHAAKADEKTLKNEFVMKGLQLRRIDAELTGKPLLRQLSDPADLFQTVEAQYRDHRQTYLDTEGQQKEALSKAEHEYASAMEILAKLREVTPILKDQADAYTELGKEGFAGKLMVKDKQREYLEKSRDLRAQESTVASLQAAINESKKQLSQISSKYRSELQNSRIEVESQYRKLEQDIAKQEHKNDLLELKAPQAGIVKDLATHTVGTVVSPGTVLLSLVPENEPLIADVMIKNDDVGFVHPQQKVKLKLVAYPFEKYGMLEGEVFHIGPDATESQDSTLKNEQKNSTYKVLILLKKQTLEAQTEKLKLVPGMQVIAEIHQGNRTVMEYLLSPVQKNIHDSARER